MTTVSVAQCTEATLTAAPLAEIEADVVVVTVGKDSDGLLLDPDAAALDVDGVLVAQLERGGFTGDWGAQQYVHLASLSAGALLVVGSGAEQPGGGPRVSLRDRRHALAAGVRSIKSGTVAVSDGTVLDSLLVEAVVLATYRFDRYAARPRPAALVIADLPTADEPQVDQLTSRLESVCFARDWVNAAPSDKRPAQSAELLLAAAERAGVEVRVWTTEELMATGAEGIVGVGQGSAVGQTARIVQLTARGTSDEPPLVLVGKGITYDAGGVNLKNIWLEHMKLDLGGAAAVAGAVLHAGRQPGTRTVEGWIALAENVISSTSYLAGDVLRMHNGLTVEVVNTDAEGRLALADAMSIADAGRAAAVITVATLTGAAIRSLGPRTAALMSTDDALAEALLEAAATSGESLWRMPCMPHYGDTLRSHVADTTNLGSTDGQTMVASAFLRRFAPAGVPYAHLDLAGPAFNMGDPYDDVPAGGTGYGVRTLIDLLHQLER